jgi:hypothetical protein
MAPLVSSDAPALDSGNTLEGRVCHEQSGARVPHVLIVMRVKGRELKASTDSTGRYVLKGIPLGNFTVEARGLGYYREARLIDFGDCGVRIVDARGKTIDSAALNPVTCRANQWLAFSLRPRPVY